VCVRDGERGREIETEGERGRERERDEASWLLPGWQHKAAEHV